MGSIPIARSTFPDMLHISKRILISAPRELVRRYLQDLENIPRYESKARLLTVTETDQAGARLAASGRFLGLPWRGEFQVEFTPDGGYRASMTVGPLKSMTSSFNLRAVSGGTVLTHEEHYGFRLPLRPLMRLFRPTLGHVMDRELRVIKEGAELVHRRCQLDAVRSL
ncbi:MAG: SRPBCC family protein [Elusimicrobia bacterium]|nr:SRPBCC family protein [Elusimicrobiota bacterium]